MNMFRTALCVAVIVALSSAPCLSAEPAATDPLPAHKVGWTKTRGGDGAPIVRVTTLAPQGPGSLGEAVAMTTPRYIVFEVGGVIDLQEKKYSIKSPCVTIAGQTAPSPGITLIRGGISVATHNVVIQHIAIRPGDAGRPKKSGWEVDGITTTAGACDVIVDHCSLTWAVDENLSASGTRFGKGTEDPNDWRSVTSHRITFSNNIIAQGLSDSTHSKGEHSKGTLVHDNTTDIAIVGNLYAGNVDRNPLFKGGVRAIFANNLIASPGRSYAHYALVASEWGSHTRQTGRVSLVGNVATEAPASPKVKRPSAFFVLHGDGPCEVFLSDNELPAGLPILAAGTKACEKFILKTQQPPTWPEGFAALPSSAIRKHIAEDVGARPWDRDPIDKRIVKEALAGKAMLIDSQSQVGGYPVRPATKKEYRPADACDAPAR
jgi:pectate lyase